MQLDLFFDSADVMRRNAVIDALLARDAAAMRAGIERLRADFPEDGSLDDFERLFSELCAPVGPDVSAEAVTRRVQQLEAQLRPSLTKVLGADAAQRWLEPVYGDIALAVAGQPFVRESAAAHAARLFLRANQLASARAAVTQVPSWRRIPEPLAWMTEIALRDKDPDEYWPLAAELAWIAPSLFGEVFPRSASAAELRLYQAFLAEGEADGESDERAWFPAWLLVRHAELLRFLRPAQRFDSRPARSAALLVDLLLGERQGLTPTVVSKRRQLRRLAPAMFELYIAQR